MCKAVWQPLAVARWFDSADRRGLVKSTVLLTQNPLKIKSVSPGLLRKLMGEMVFSSFAGAKPARSKSVSPGLLRKLFWRVTFAWRGKSHQNRADRTRILRRNYTGMGLTEILHSPSLILGPV